MIHPIIICVDCGGEAHLLNPPQDDEVELPQPLVLSYRCADCNDRWDVVYDAADEDSEPHTHR